MDKVILNNGTSIDIDSSGIVTSANNGLILTFENQTISYLDSLMTPNNIAEIKLATADGNVYGNYKNLTYVSIMKINTTDKIVVTLAIADATQEQINYLRQQVAVMLLAMAEGGLI